VLARLLGSKSRAAILTRLLLEPDAEIHLNDLVRATGLSPRAVQQEVDRLVGLGLIVERRSGNRRYLRAASGQPAIGPLTELVRMTSGIPVRLSSLFESDPRIQLALLFGSFARGEERASSYVDLLVVGDLRLLDLVTMLEPVSAEAGHAINPVLMTYAEFRDRRARKEHFIARVLSAPFVVLKGSPDDFTGSLDGEPMDRRARGEPAGVGRPSGHRRPRAPRLRD
jgi:predicted nucleotidyltransferase